MILRIVAIATIATISTARAEVGCMSPADLSWTPSLVKHFSLIDTQGRGCVTADQITRYKYAVKLDGQGKAERIKALLASGKE